MGKKSFTSLVQLLSMNEDNIWISQFIKQKGISGFMNPLVNLVNGNLSKDLNNFHIITLMKHRDPDPLDKDKATKPGEGGDGSWLVVICFGETEETT